jgi:uncharacterized radical SAM superfamily Fe-S cluster-containing enzyme
MADYDIPDILFQSKSVRSSGIFLNYSVLVETKVPKKNMIPIYKTESLCSVCLKKIPASVNEKDGRVYLSKICPDHDLQEVMISSDASWFHRQMKYAPRLTPPAQIKNKKNRGCPFDCGYCESHQQRIYLPVIPITSSCNLDCPVCYTINKNDPAYFMSENQFSLILEKIRSMDPALQIINFTGGEPLLHPQFPRLAEMCHQAGIHRITVSTNGLKLLEDVDLLPRLTDLGVRIVLSFNSFRSEPYLQTAGVDLLEKKLRILELLQKNHTPTTLLAVAAKGINDQELGDIVKTVINSDFIISAEIHTVTFTGNSQQRFQNQSRLTSWDVIADIVNKNPALQPEDFFPSPCSHPQCYTVAYLLKLANGDVIPFNRFIPENDFLEMLCDNLYIEPSQKNEEIFRKVLDDLWSRQETSKSQQEIMTALKDIVRRIYSSPAAQYFNKQKETEAHAKEITIHSHMDAETFDSERIRQCCGAVPTEQGSFIPTCAYNIIYRARDAHFCETPAIFIK